MNVDESTLANFRKFAEDEPAGRASDIITILCDEVERLKDDENLPSFDLTWDQAKLASYMALLQNPMAAASGLDDVIGMADESAAILHKHGLCGPKGGEA